MASIDHLTAHDGGIECFAGLGNKVGYAKSAQALAQLFAQHGLAPVCSGSSSLDFCSEYGFPDNTGAHAMCDEAVSIYNWEVNGVAS